jgi:hypothetical protein
MFFADLVDEVAGTSYESTSLGRCVATSPARYMASVRRDAMSWRTGIEQKARVSSMKRSSADAGMAPAQDVMPALLLQVEVTNLTNGSTTPCSGTPASSSGGRHRAADREQLALDTATSSYTR